MDKSHYDNEKFAALRKKIGTQEEVANLLGITPIQLSRVENGKSASYQLLFDFADIAKVDVRSLLRPNNFFSDYLTFNVNFA